VLDHPVWIVSEHIRTHFGYVQDPTSLIQIGDLQFSYCSFIVHSDRRCINPGEPRFCNTMKSYGSNQARLFGSRLRRAPASGSDPSIAHSDERDPCSETVMMTTGVRGNLLGILLMHAVLIGVILACAALAQS
jgi:hypothetical protein